MFQDVPEWTFHLNELRHDQDGYYGFNAWIVLVSKYNRLTEKKKGEIYNNNLTMLAYS